MHCLLLAEQIPVYRSLFPDMNEERSGGFAYFSKLHANNKFAIKIVGLQVTKPGAASHHGMLHQTRPDKKTTTAVSCHLWQKHLNEIDHGF